MIPGLEMEKDPTMRSILAVGLVCLGLLALTPSTSQAQFVTYPRVVVTSPVYSNSFYAPGFYNPGFYNPGFYNSGFYTPPYVWRGNYRITPFGGRFSYGEYYPWTNQYFYQYRYFR
jgi:hypothetical protein